MSISIVGLSIAVIIFLPNILFIIFPPQNVPKGLSDAGLIYTILERIGQAGCFLMLATLKNNYHSLNIDIWFILMVFCIISYYGLWIRYVVKGQNLLL